MTKGEKLRPKQLDQPTTCEFQKTVELEFVFFCQNTLIAKYGLLWGRILIMGKREVFGT
jgi:hypothetical protein